MKTIRPNIGLLNSYVRLFCGFGMLAWGTAKLIKQPFRNTPIFIVAMGAMKVAEGITRFCPLTYYAEEKLEDIDEKKQYDDLVNPS